MATAMAAAPSDEEKQIATRKEGGGAGKAEIEAAHQQKVLDTPRTREACEKLGLITKDLQPRSYDSFYIPGDKKELQTLRFEHFEKKRKERLAQVLAERAKINIANAKKGEVPSGQSGQFLTMLESLFEKEAKRLESDLKAQLRQHSSLVKENDEQLRKEELLATKMEMRDQRCKDVENKMKETSLKTRERTETRLAQNHAINQINAEKHLEKQKNFAREMIAEEERMERFNQEKAMVASEKSAVWKDKVERMRQKNEQMQLEKKEQGEAKLLELEAKIEAVSANRDEQQRMRLVRSEEQHLHLMDVREKKDRIDRVEHHRRTEIKEQIDNNVERIETLLALKDQLLDQRRARTIKAEATRGSRGLNLGRDCKPGPGQYEAPVSCMFENPGVKIAQCNTGHSEFIDQVTRTTAANPPPGAYDLGRLRNGDRVENASASCPKFGNGNRDSFLDDAIKAKSGVPAPGRYETKHTLDHKGTKIRRERVSDPGLDKFSAKRYPVWARPGTDTPGPAGYSTDDYTRKEVMRRAQSSLPALTRNMLRPIPEKAAK